MSVKLSDILISLAQTLIQSGNNPEIDKNSVHDFSTLFKIKDNEINFFKSHLGKITFVSNDNQTIN
jgi:hypothetical protein